MSETPAVPGDRRRRGPPLGWLERAPVPDRQPIRLLEEPRGGPRPDDPVGWQPVRPLEGPHGPLCLPTETPVGGDAQRALHAGHGGATAADPQRRATARPGQRVGRPRADDAVGRQVGRLLEDADGGLGLCAERAVSRHAAI